MKMCNEKRNITNIQNADFTAMGNTELIIAANDLFKLFKQKFEKNCYDDMTKISECCKIIAEICISRNNYIEYYSAETLIDIACFVFEQMHLYAEKSAVLKAIGTNCTVNKSLRIRALKELLSPEPEVQHYISDDIKRFTDMLSVLSD